MKGITSSKRVVKHDADEGCVHSANNSQMSDTCRCCVKCQYMWGEECDVVFEIEKLEILGDLNTAAEEQALSCEMRRWAGQPHSRLRRCLRSGDGDFPVGAVYKNQPARQRTQI